MAILAAILDLKVKMTSFMNLSHANGFVMLMLVQNDAPLVKISDLIPEILLITNSKWPLAAILDFWPITGHSWTSGISRLRRGVSLWGTYTLIPI